MKPKEYGKNPYSFYESDSSERDLPNKIVVKNRVWRLFVEYIHVELFISKRSTVYFILASAVRNCQLTLATMELRSHSQAYNSSWSFEILYILRDKHCRVITLSSISAMSSQLPCWG